MQKNSRSDRYQAPVFHVLLGQFPEIVTGPPASMSRTLLSMSRFPKKKCDSIETCRSRAMAECGAIVERVLRLWSPRDLYE